MLSLTNLIGFGARRAVDPGIAPDEITTQTLVWWGNADAANITTEAGGRVTQMRDLSGNANHVSAASGSSTRPTLQSAALNGLDTILFDGSDDSLRGTWASLGTFALHCFLVFRQVTWTGNDYVYTPTSNSSRYVQQRNSSPEIYMLGSSANFNPVSPTLSTFVLMQTGFLGTTASFQSLNDGAKVTGGDEGDLEPFAGLALGSSAAPSNYGNVEIAELAMFSGEITDATELAGLKQYFNARYALWA